MIAAVSQLRHHSPPFLHETTDIFLSIGLEHRFDIVKHGIQRISGSVDLYAGGFDNVTHLLACGAD